MAELAPVIMADSPSIPQPGNIRPATLPMGDYELRFECLEMGDEYEDRARRELRETPDVVREALKEFKRLLREEEGLNVPHDEEWFLYQFLRPCKFYPESALLRARSFYQFKDKYPKMCRSLLPRENENIFLQGLLTILPNRDQHGRRILVLECGRKWKPALCSTDEIMRGVMLMLEAAMLEPRTQVSGVNMIWDTEGLAMEHALQLSPSFAKMLLHWVQDCIPMRVKALHVVNQSLIFKMAFAIFKPFIGQKLRNRLFFHGHDRQSLLRHVDAKALPTKYGGSMELDEAPGADVFKLFSSFEQVFVERLNHRYISPKA